MRKLNILVCKEFNLYVVKAVAYRFVLLLLLSIIIIVLYSFLFAKWIFFILSIFKRNIKQLTLHFLIDVAITLVTIPPSQSSDICFTCYEVCIHSYNWLT